MVGPEMNGTGSVSRMYANKQPTVSYGTCRVTHLKGIIDFRLAITEWGAMTVDIE